MPVNESALIATALGVNMNATGDTSAVLSAYASGKRFVVDYCLVKNVSIQLNAASADIWSGVGGTGQQYSDFVGTGVLDFPVNPHDWGVTSGPNSTRGRGMGTTQSTAPIVNVSAPQGVPATADFYVFGRAF